MRLNLRGAIPKQVFDRWAVLALAAAWSFLAVAGSTFSWVTSSDTKVNEFRGEVRFGASISEQFTANAVLRPGTAVRKEVRATNMEQAAAFVRMSLRQALALRGTDPATGNAASGAAETFELTFAEWFELSPGGGLGGSAWEWFSPRLGAAGPPDTGQPAYWAFDGESFDGWLYYSEPLPPTETTGPFLIEIEAHHALPNRIKNADYHVTVTLEAVQAAPEALAGQWGLGVDSPVYQLLAGKTGGQGTAEQ
jgi:alternate signal-mediated exported protein